MPFPVGSNDRSQAIYCLVSVRKRNRPVGYGMIGSDRRATIRTINQPRVLIRPCPTGTDSRFDVFQAINCLATITSPFLQRRPELRRTGRDKPINYLSTFSKPHHSAWPDSRTRTRRAAALHDPVSTQHCEAHPPELECFPSSLWELQSSGRRLPQMRLPTPESNHRLNRPVTPSHRKLLRT